MQLVRREAICVISLPGKLLESVLAEVGVPNFTPPRTPPNFRSGYFEASSYQVTPLASSWLEI
jgi:hypothetical protein